VTVAPTAQESPKGSSPVRRKFGRRKFDQQPEQPAAVLIAANGVPIPGAALRSALRIAAGRPVAVMTIARLYGSSLGLQNPGLMPSRKELAEQGKIVERAISSLEKAGAQAWGQIAISRKPAKTIAAAVKARGAVHIIVVRPEQPVRWRRVVEGDLVTEVVGKVGPDVEVEGVSP
jgi:hypothetical protein